MASAASVTLQSHAQGSSREDGVSAWGIYTGCSQREFLKTFYFEIIVDSRAIVRNQRAIPTPFVTSCKTIKICHNQEMHTAAARRPRRGLGFHQCTRVVCARARSRVALCHSHACEVGCPGTDARTALSPDPHAALQDHGQPPAPSLSWRQPATCPYPLPFHHVQDAAPRESCSLQPLQADFFH